MNYHSYSKKKRASFSDTMLVLTILFSSFRFCGHVLFLQLGKGDAVGACFAYLVQDPDLRQPLLWLAFKNSIIIALTSSITATVLGSLAAIGITWYRFKGRSYITTISYLPMVLPEVIIGISMLIFFSSVKIKLGMFTIFVAHATFNLPFVFMMVQARLDEFDYSTIEAARDLGANERQALMKVVVPAIMPAILSSFLMCTTMSLEDFVITFFVSGPGSGTLPLYVYSMIRYGVSPVINALSFVMILGTMLIAFTFRRFLKTAAAST